MATTYVIEIPGMNQEQSAAVLRELGLTNTPPTGQILHIEGPMEGGGTRRHRGMERDPHSHRGGQAALAAGGVSFLAQASL